MDPKIGCVNRIPVFGGNGIAGYTSRALLTEPSVIVGRVGQKCGEVYVTDGPVWITDNALYPRHIRKPINTEFFALALKAAGLNNLKNRNDLPLVTQSIVHALRVAWPPKLSEQEVIAQTLKDVESLLEALGILIAKKRDLKQAAMQQLLSGRTRLPGFTDEWEAKTLGELGSTYGGLTGKTKDDFGQGAAQYVTFMNVISNVQIDCDIFESVRVQPNESQNHVRKGDLLLNGSSETPEEVALCGVINRNVPDLFLNSFCFGFRFHEDAQADGLFIAMYLRSREGRELIKSLAQGSTRYNLSKSALLRSSLRLPKLNEQIAIATAIADMDAELGTLEQRLSKTRDLKQAMMQELLTGKTRLVAAEVAHA